MICPYCQGMGDMKIKVFSYNFVIITLNEYTSEFICNRSREKLYQLIDMKCELMKKHLKAKFDEIENLDEYIEKHIKEKV